MRLGSQDQIVVVSTPEHAGERLGLGFAEGVQRKLTTGLHAIVRQRSDDGHDAEGHVEGSR
jgi:hypothetical protein